MKNMGLLQQRFSVFVLTRALTLALIVIPALSAAAQSKVSAEMSTAFDRASYHGKYRSLIQKIDCPSERANDEAQYGVYADAGYFEAVDYCGRVVPAGYWVYEAPFWYLWQKKDLATIGFDTLSRTVPLKKQNLTLRFDFSRPHRVWAQAQVDTVARALQEMERRTGIAYPGDTPYVIEEDLYLQDLLGLAGPSGMKLASPPEGTPWTVLHEVVHIWNAHQRPTWIIEGQANYYSFLMMQDLKLPFMGDETYPAYIKDWREIQGTAEDLPLENHYLDLPQGKAMAWWAMIHELFGPDFVTRIFVRLSQEEQLSTPQLAEMIRQAAAGKDPAPLLDGWVRKGAYRVKKTTDFGPVRYPLVGAWPLH